MSGDLRDWTLNNIYTIARRETLKNDPRGRWGHVLRLCEAVGCKGAGVLRDNGGSVTPDYMDCPTCKGIGHTPSQSYAECPDNCPKCAGAGIVPDRKCLCGDLESKHTKKESDWRDVPGCTGHYAPDSKGQWHK